ncbi:MAG: type II secretion system protein [Candidatus Saccharimonadales bacterium]
MKKHTLDSQGFTIIELLVFIIVITAIAVVGISNIRTLRAQNRDTASKTDINAIYYQLESFHEKNGYYPEKVEAASLAGIDPESLKDKNNLEINAAGSTYAYKPAACVEAKCKSFELSAQLEKEAPFIKQSLNK